MFVNPRIAIDQGWITVPTRVTSDELEKYIQPNALDVSAAQLLRVNQYAHDVCIISEKKRVLPRPALSAPPALTSMPMYSDLLFWRIESGATYDVTSDFYVEVPENHAAMIFIRSSLSRAGLRLSCGLFDSSFKGNIGFSLTNTAAHPVMLEQFCRVAQVAFVPVDAAKAYAGGWSHDNGTHWSNGSTNGKEST